MHFVRTSNSPAETAIIGRALGRMLRTPPSPPPPRPPLLATRQPGDIILVDGPLGAGKTTFARAVAEGMELDTGGGSPVSSPTFVMVHEYAPRGGGLSLIHVDAYRLRDEADLESLGWDRITQKVNAGEAAMLIEWAERLGPRFLDDRNPAHPPHPVRIRIEHIAEDQREFSFTIPDEWSRRPGPGIADLAARAPARCPITGEEVPADSPTYPFSSERARLADLYRWFSGSYHITRPLDERDLQEGID